MRLTYLLEQGVHCEQQLELKFKQRSGNALASSPGSNAGAGGKKRAWHPLFVQRWSSCSGLEGMTIVAIWHTRSATEFWEQCCTDNKIELLHATVTNMMSQHFIEWRVQEDYKILTNLGIFYACTNSGYQAAHGRKLIRACSWWRVLALYSTFSTRIQQVNRGAS